MAPGLVVFAALATLIFPGIGQGLAGRRTRMAVFAVADVATALLILFSVWMLPVNLLIRLAATIDAWRCMRASAPTPNWALAAAAVVIGAFGFGVTGQYLEGFKIPTSSMYPTLVIGDQVYVDKLSVSWRAPERGEVLVFTQPCSRHVYIKRVIAVPRDTVEVRCSVVYVNGKAIPTTLVDAHASYKDRDELRGEWHERSVSRYREVLGGHTYEVFADEARPQREAVADSHDFPLREKAMFTPACAQSGFYEPDPKRAKQPVGTFVETKPEGAATACEPQLHFVVPEGGLFVMGDNRNNANDSRYWGVVPNELMIGRAIGIYSSTGVEGSWRRFGAIH